VGFAYIARPFAREQRPRVADQRPPEYRRTTLQSQAYSQLLESLVQGKPELAGRVSLEITEADVLANPQAAHDFTQAARQLGLGIVIDRFGTGVASFQQLRDLEPDIAKLGADLVAALDDTPGQDHIVRAVCENYHALGLKAVAPGIERTETLTAVKALPFDAVKGQALAAPESLTHPAA